MVHPQIVVRRDLTGKLVEVLTGGPSADLPHDANVESWIHVEIDRETDRGDLKQITADLLRVLNDVRETVEDWGKMRDAAVRIAEQLPDEPTPADLPPRELEEARELLRWLADDHFTFLGYREYELREDDSLAAVAGTGLGILRSDPHHATDSSHPVSPSFERLPADARAKAREHRLLVLTKANSRPTVHRPSYLDYIGVKKFDADGNVVCERRFLGLFSSAAYTESVRRVPVIRRKVEEVLERAGFSPNSHDGRDLLQILETYPRDELFQTPPDELRSIVTSVLYLQERRRLRLYLRQDEYGRYYSALVYLPRDRYTTGVRLRIIDILKEELGGTSVDFTAWNTESILSRLHFVVRVPQGTELPHLSDADKERVEARLVEAARSWADGFAEALTAEFGEEHAAELLRRYGSAFPEGYKADHGPRSAVADLGHLERLDEDRTFALSLYEPVGAAPEERRFKIYQKGGTVSLSAVLPVLSRLGVEVTDERPYDLRCADRTTAWIYDFGLRMPKSVAGGADYLGDDARERFQEAFAATWNGQAENDGFNALVLSAGLTWRQAMVLRAYAKYLRQAGSTFSQDYMEDTLRNNVHTTRLLVSLFEARMAPERQRAGREIVDALLEEVDAALDQVASLDEDRILRSFLTVIKATLRTNFFQKTSDGKPHDYVSMKFDPQAIPDLPAPRPAFEIWVYSPRVEGVHLRFGKVARGGLRWSDRREDFRTEILGLVKAQMVKNTVIVPVGAKGGFVAKQLPDPNVDRDAWMAEGIASYRTFISALLDITDNMVAGEVVPPADVVRHDEDDTYLVVAADKGTAKFSDIANEVAESYNFWLGDAFASGGSAGYDHKGMGITARGAWESVKRHFRELGVDTQTQDFTVVGIGDMSGDVFGNGMLLSEHIRLVAAFDHRHVFIDPNPDSATSYAERRRLFDLPRSSWEDYDSALISAGGGVFPRTANSIPVNAHIREALGIEAGVTKMTPADLMKAILSAPVDLLWNGGIGTYVKASTESNGDVGDKGNDAIRVDGKDLRVQVVGEGGNLGLTQLGRIEFARNGGKINTDAIDNSAGVDTSDHEVNIKILLNGLVKDGDMTVKQRNKLLAEMTDEVGALVLRNKLRAEHGDRQRARPVQGHAPRPAALHAPPGPRGPPRPGAGVPAHRPPDPRAPGRRARPDRPGDGRAAGLHEDHGRRGAAAHLAARRPVPQGPAARLLPDGAARAVPGPYRQPPAAPRDHHDRPGQRHGQHGRYDVSAPDARGDRRIAGGDRAGADRGPGDLPVLPGVGRGGGPGHQGRGRHPDPYPAALAASGRARHALAAQQPAAAAGAGRDGGLLRRACRAGLGGAAEAAARRGRGVVPAHLRRADRRRGAGRAGHAGRRVLLGLPDAGHRVGGRPHGQGAAGRRRGLLRPRRPARRHPADGPHQRPAPHRPLAVDGPRRDPRGPVRGPRGAHRRRAGGRQRHVDAGAAVQGVGAEERGDPRPGPQHAGGDPGLGDVRPVQPVRGLEDDADAAAHACVTPRPCEDPRVETTRGSSVRCRTCGLRPVCAGLRPVRAGLRRLSWPSARAWRPAWP